MESEVVGLGRYAAAIRRRGWLVVAFTLILAAAAFGYSTTRPAQYSSTAQVLVSPYSSAQFNEPTFTTAQVDTQVAVMQSLSIATPVVAKLGLDETPSALLKSVSAASVGDTSTITVTVTRSSPTLAAKIANAMSDSYLAFRASHQPAGAKNTTAGVVITPAQPASHRSGRSPVFSGVLGGVIGLILGSIAAIVMAARDKSIGDEAALAGVTNGLPVLARIPRKRPGPRGSPARESPGSREALAYRFLAATVRALDGSRHKAARGDLVPTVVVISSAASGDGRTSVAANLALAAAATGQRVLLCDADQSNAGLTKILALPDVVTLDRVLRTNGAVDPARLARPAPGLLALGTHEASADSPTPLGNGSFARLVSNLVSVVDIVIVDTSPLLASAEALELARDADVLLLTVRERSSRRADVAEALERIQQVGGTVAGVVLTRSSVRHGVQRPSRRRASSVNARRSAVTPVAAAASTSPTDLSSR